MRAPSGVKRGSGEAREPAVGLREHEEEVAHRRRAEPLVAGELVLGRRPAAVQRPRGVVLARTSEPPCFSVIAIPHSAPRLLRRGDEARGRTAARSAAAPTRRRARAARAARARRRRSSRSGSRGRPPAEHVHAAPPRATCAPGRGSRHGSACRPCLDARAASARARPGGTRPRRCGGRSGRGCAASAGSRWPPARGPATPGRRAARRSRRPARAPSRRPRGSSASTSGRLDSKALWPSQRRRLVDDVVRGLASGDGGAIDMSRRQATSGPCGARYSIAATPTR